MKIIKQNLKLKIFLFLCLYFAIPSFANAATYYMSESGLDDCTNLHDCFDLMSGGDTLIIRDGTYTGEDNVLDSWHYPPSGNTSAYTLINAESKGEVIFNGENERFMFYKDGNTAGMMQYVSFDGIGWFNSNVENVRLSGGVNNIKFTNCFFVDAGSNSDSFNTHTTSYILLEDCASWGNARYHFHYYNTDYSIFRRCVARHDRGSWVYQTGFQVYNSQYIDVQNCIFIDGDQLNFYNSPEQYYGFKIPQVSRGNIKIEGSIALNSSASFLFIQAGADNTVNNCCAWDLAGGDYFRGISVEMSHNTYGDFVGDGTRGDGASKLFYNSILYAIGDNAFELTGGLIDNDYNVLFGNYQNYSGVSVGVNDYSFENSNEINPFNNSLEYLPRIETESDLSGAGSDGGDIGANMLYKIGIDGTLWGEDGYDEITSESLWPFPNEDIIKEKMSEYTWDDGSGGDPEILGARGFCAEGNGLYGGPITLTSYIWEYLGNSCPEDICDYGDPDTTPPSAPSGLSVS